jgi:membrane protein implicated in regulation of membrane protease activity
VLLMLLGLDVLVTGAAAFGLLPWWSVAVPVALTIAFLVLCRTQVRRQNAADWDLRDAVPSGADASADERSVAPRRAIRVDAAYGTPRSARNDQGFEEVSPEEDTVTLSASALAAAAAAGSPPDASRAGSPARGGPGPASRWRTGPPTACERPRHGA